MVGEFTNVSFFVTSLTVNAPDRAWHVLKKNNGKPIYSCTHSFVLTGFMYARLLTVNHEGLSLRLPFESRRRNFKPLPCDIPIPQTLNGRPQLPPGRFQSERDPDEKSYLCRYISQIFFGKWLKTDPILNAGTRITFFKRCQWLYSKK